MRIGNPTADVQMPLRSEPLLDAGQDIGEVCFIPGGLESLVLYPQLLCLLLFHCIHRNVTQQGQVLGYITSTCSAISFP